MHEETEDITSLVLKLQGLLLKDTTRDCQLCQYPTREPKEGEVEIRLSWPCGHIEVVKLRVSHYWEAK